MVHTVHRSVCVCEKERKRQRKNEYRFVECEYLKLLGFTQEKKWLWHIIYTHTDILWMYIVNQINIFNFKRMLSIQRRKIVQNVKWIKLKHTFYAMCTLLKWWDRIQCARYAHEMRTRHQLRNGFDVNTRPNGSPFSFFLLLFMYKQMSISPLILLFLLSFEHLFDLMLSTRKRHNERYTVKNTLISWSYNLCFRSRWTSTKYHFHHFSIHFLLSWCSLSFFPSIFILSNQRHEFYNLSNRLHLKE